MAFVEELLAYACSRFEEGNYSEALENFILAYNEGYEQEWILENIYRCYIAGNESEFQTSYEQCCIYEDIPYELCTLDFAPYKEGEYFIYDKIEKMFLGKISVQEIGKIGEPEQEFSDVAAMFDWDWREYQKVLKWAMCRKVYVICKDKNRAVSFCKIPELADYFSRLTIFTNKESYQAYFHKHTGVYLPKCFVSDEQGVQELKQIWEEEHAYRLTEEGRNRDNILLTIGIPTRDRGYLALDKVKKLLDMIYDAEIEIVVSKHNVMLYQEEYEKISLIPDARLFYKDHVEGLALKVNLRNTFELARGKYVLLVSDEDNVLLTALDHYLAVLQKNPELYFVRPRTVVQSFFIDKTQQAKKGIEAFSIAVFSNNYFSSSIVRREAFLQLPFDKIDEYAVDNIFYRSYPHEWWFSMLLLEGDYRMDRVCLISEGEGVGEKEAEDYMKAGEAEQAVLVAKEDGLPSYATYESRLEQFKGYIAFIHFIEDRGIDIVKEGVSAAIGKTSHLLNIAYSIYKYKQSEIEDVLEKYIRLCKNAIDEFSFDDTQKIDLLQQVRFYAERIAED